MQAGSSSSTNDRANPPVFFASVLGRMMLKIAVVVGAMLVGVALAARELDRAMGTEPWLTLLFMCIASPFATWVAYRIGQGAVARLQPPADAAKAG
jgi:hypothetical protein